RSADEQDCRDALLRRIDGRGNRGGVEDSRQHRDARLERGEGVALRSAERRRILMEPARWRRITDIYHATIARRPEERATFVGQECHGDKTLRKQVEAMVESHERTGDIIEAPAVAIAPELLFGVQTIDIIPQTIGQ